MTTPTGTITMTDIQTEFGGANPISLNEYYAGGSYVPAGLAPGVPTSGTISMDNLRGKAKASYGTLSPGVSTVVEGNSVTFTWSGASGLTNGTYYYRLEGTNITADDFTTPATNLIGTFSVTSNAGSFTVTVKNDNTPDTDGTFRALIGLPGDSTVSSPVVASGYVTITDSTNWGTLEPSASTRVEGNSVTFTITGASSIPTGTYYYKLVSVNSSNITTADFSTPAPAANLQGSFTVTSNSGAGGNFTVTIASDGSREPEEYFAAQVGTTSGFTTPVLTSTAVVILATGTITVLGYGSSTAGPFTAGTTQYRSNTIYRTIYFRVTNTSLPVGSSVTWSVGAESGYSIDTSHLESTSGTVTLDSNGEAVFGVTAWVDYSYFSGNKLYRVYVKDTNSIIPLYNFASSSIITLVNSPSYSTTQSKSAIYRVGSAADRTVNINIFVANIQPNSTTGTNPTSLSWSTNWVSGIVDSTDISPVSGTFNNPGDSSPFVRSIVAVDQTTTARSEEQFNLAVSHGAYSISTASNPDVIIYATPTGTLTWSTNSISEGDIATLDFSTSNAPSSATFTLTWGGTATSGSDYTIPATTFAYFDSTTLTTTMDATSESTETITVSARYGTSLSVASAASISLSNVSNTISTLTLTKTGGTTLGSTITITCSMTVGSTATYARSFHYNIYYTAGGVNYGPIAASNTIDIGAYTNSVSNQTLYGPTTSTTGPLTNFYIITNESPYVAKQSNIIAGPFYY